VQRPQSVRGNVAVLGEGVVNVGEYAGNAAAGLRGPMGQRQHGTSIKQFVQRRAIAVVLHQADAGVLGQKAARRAA